MKNTIFSTLFISGLLALNFISNELKAQDTDSLLFVNKEWKIKKLKRGIVWKQASFEGFFDSKQEINYVEIDLRRHAKALRLAGVSKGFKKTSEFATEHNAIVAINGGFFDTKIGGGVDLIKIDGEIVNESRSTNVRANAWFVFGKKGKNVKIVSAKSVEDFGEIQNVMVSGPILLEDGKMTVLDKNAFNQNRHPRSAIAMRGRKLILMTVDGRNAQAQGMTLSELSKIFYWLKMDAAMNLDGGGSSTLFVRGQTPNGIVSYPSDNAKFDHNGERRVANAILIKD